MGRRLRLGQVDAAAHRKCQRHPARRGIGVAVQGLMDHQMQLSERVSELEEEEPPR